MHGLARYKHECRCSHSRGADVSFRDVTMKIPDRGCEQGCEWRHAPEAWAEIWEKSVSWVSATEEDSWELDSEREGSTCGACRGQTNFCATGAARDWGGGADEKVIIEGLCTSLPCVETFNSKVIKGFVPELRSRKCFVFRDSYVIYIWTLWTFLRTGMNMSISRIHIWLCNRSLKVFWSHWECTNS